MSDMGYYNYYNNVNRYSPDLPVDRYAQMINRYVSNSDSIHHNNENPYSEENLVKREFELKLSQWANDVRSQCSTKQDVYSFLAKKYFNKETSTYLDRERLDEKIKAAYDNDLNAILYGTYHNSDMRDYRINWSEKDWQTLEKENKAFNLATINFQMQNILSKNKIELNEDDSFVININPYDYKVTLYGINNKNIVNALNSNNNSKELFYYILQNSSQNLDSLIKYRAYHNTLDLTGYKFSDLIEKEDGFYTRDNKNILDIIKENLKNDSSTPFEFKQASYDYAQSLIDEVFISGYNNIKDLNLSIGYSKKDGFFNVNVSQIA